MIVEVNDDVQLEICKYCSVDEILKLIHTSKRWQENELWLQKLMKVRCNMVVKLQSTWYKSFCEMVKYHLWSLKLTYSSQNIERLIQLDPVIWQLNVFKQVPFKQLPIILTFKQFETLPPKLYHYNRFLFLTGFITLCRSIPVINVSFCENIRN